VKGRELFTLRITQGVETSNHDNPLLPMNIEIGIKEPFKLKMSTTYDLKKGDLETVDSDLSFKISKVNLIFGQTFNKTEDIKVYRTGVDVPLFNHLQLSGNLWYDAQLHTLSNIGTSMKYTAQCWSVRLDMAKYSGHFNTRVLFELAGINGKTSPRTTSEHSPFYF
jgi:lipopolysaccharide assembly outer membrane protein LptD (OstA)